MIKKKGQIELFRTVNVPEEVKGLDPDPICSLEQHRIEEIFEYHEYLKKLKSYLQKGFPRFLSHHDERSSALGEF